MIQSRSMFAVAALTLIGVAVLAPSGLAGAGARAAGQQDYIEQRIADAFDVVPGFEAEMVAAGKGDRLDRPCADQQWPAISPDCLATADGRPVRPVRTVTIGYPIGEAASVLIRMPAQEVASR
jgi:hypothetical protein